MSGLSCDTKCWNTILPDVWFTHCRYHDLLNCICLSGSSLLQKHVEWPNKFQTLKILVRNFPKMKSPILILWALQEAQSGRSWAHLCLQAHLIFNKTWSFTTHVENVSLTWMILVFSWLLADALSNKETVRAIIVFYSLKLVMKFY